MFSRMKKRIDPVFFVFLFITFALISSLAVAVLYFFSGNSLASKGQIGEGEAVALYEALVEDNETPSGQASRIVSSYRDYMAEVGRMVDSDQVSSAELLEKTVQKLLGVRVPEQFLDQHLKAVLDLRGLSLGKEEMTEDSLRSGLKQTMDILLEYIKKE